MPFMYATAGAVVSDKPMEQRSRRYRFRDSGCRSVMAPPRRRGEACFSLPVSYDEARSSVIPEKTINQDYTEPQLAPRKGNELL